MIKKLCDVNKLPNLALHTVEVMLVVQLIFYHIYVSQSEL